MEDLNYRHVSEIWTSVLDRLIAPPQGIALPQWPKMTSYLRGLRPHELTILCAPTGSGKTEFLCNISAQLLIQDVPHFVAPVETGDRDFLIRMLSCIEGENFKKKDALPPMEAMLLSERMMPRLLNKRFWIASYDGRVDVTEMVNLLKLMYQQGAQVAILDNLNFFLKVTRAADQMIEMDEAVREFVMLVKNLPMHIILVCHPKKTMGEGRVESEFDIKGSSTLVQECANCILFNRPLIADVKAGKNKWTDRELVFKKLREFGENVNKPVWFSYEKCRYQEQA